MLKKAIFDHTGHVPSTQILHMKSRKTPLTGNELITALGTLEFSMKINDKSRKEFSETLSHGYIHMIQSGIYQTLLESSDDPTVAKILQSKKS